MKRNIRQCLIVAATALSFAACDVKDPIYNTPHPEQGTITLVTDWSGIGEGLTAPASYTVEAGDYSAILIGTTNLLEPLFEPGSYHLHVYNTPQHITMSGSVATVAGASGNVDGAGPFVQEMPGWLFTGVTETMIEADTDHPPYRCDAAASTPTDALHRADGQYHGQDRANRRLPFGGCLDAGYG